MSCKCNSGNVFTKRRHHKWWKFKKRQRGCAKNIFTR